MSNKKLSPEIRDYLRENARKGGKVKSPAKTAAARKANAARWKNHKRKEEEQ